MTAVDFAAMSPEQIRAHHQREERSYNIVRFYFKGGKHLLRARVTLAEAQSHCSDPETSSSTCTSPAGRRRTRTLGAWFDAYEAR